MKNISVTPHHTSAGSASASQLSPPLTSSPVIRRWNQGTPILSAADIPYEATCIFNAGVTKYQGRYIMAFRNDYGYLGGSRFRGCCIGLAFSDDGIHWIPESKPFLTPADLNDPDITRVYDPRLTVIDDSCYICFAADTHHGLRGGIARTDDFKRIEVLSLSVPDNRNMVLFPRRIQGRYARLERPFPVYSRGGTDRFDTWISFSKDLVYWGDSRLLLPVEQVAWANDKTGPAAPPIYTDKGWLTLFHGVDKDETRRKNGWEDIWQKRYSAGIMLLDLNDPSKLIGLYDRPLLAPETAYETEIGFRTNVIFPGGMVPEENGEVKIYYGASDTAECLATADIGELLSLCAPLTP